MDIDQFFLILKIVLPILIGVFSAFSLVIPFKGIITRRPFLISNRWRLYLMFVSLVTVILLFLLLPLPSPFMFKWYNLAFKWFIPAFFTGLLVTLCFRLRGFSVFGVSDITFREALITTLEKLQLPYEKTLSSMRITSVEADLQVNINSWSESGMIRIKQREHASLLTQIVSEMNTHFRMSAPPSKLTPYILALITDVPVIAGAVVFIIFLYKIV